MKELTYDALSYMPVIVYGGGPYLWETYVVYPFGEDALNAWQPERDKAELDELRGS